MFSNKDLFKTFQAQTFPYPSCLEIKSATGSYIRDINNKKYLDFTMVGIGTSVLGYSDNDMNKIAINAIKSGSMTTLNAPEDVRVAEEFLKIQTRHLCPYLEWYDLKIQQP